MPPVFGTDVRTTVRDTHAIIPASATTTTPASAITTTPDSATTTTPDSATTTTPASATTTTPDNDGLFPDANPANV